MHNNPRRNVIRIGSCEVQMCGKLGSHQLQIKRYGAKLRKVSPFPSEPFQNGPPRKYAMHSVCRSLHWRKTVVKSPSGVLGIREGRERERERLSGAIKLLKYGIGGGTSLDSSVQSRQSVAKAKGKGSV